MTFPTTSVIDSFNRANEGSLSGGGNWSIFATSYYGGHPLQLISNVVTSSSATLAGASKWAAATFGPNCEAYVTMVALPADTHYVMLWLRASDTDTANPTGYHVHYTYSAGGTDTVTVIRQDSGASATTLKTINQDFVAGDKLGASIVGTVITVYRYTSGAWSALDTYDTSGDGTKYSLAGRIVLVARDQTVTLDDFGGGTYAGASAPANTVAPAITGTATLGSTLTCSNGTWTDDGSPTFTRQWKRAGVSISGATSTTYVLAVADVATTITCTVTDTDSNGATPANSNTVTVTTPRSAASTGAGY